MSKAILITNGQHALNQTIATNLLEGGYRVMLHLETEEQAEQYIESLPAESAAQLYISYVELANEQSHVQVVDDALSVMGSLDVIIHGNELLEEEKMLIESPDELGGVVSTMFDQIFLWNKAAISYMMKRKSGKVLFPIVYDTLYYDQYRSSPITNHGKISLMKSLSRECSAFRIDVNVMTFGYHDADFDKAEKKEKQRMLEIYGLKPVLKPLCEMVGMLKFLIDAPSSLIGGQNIEIGIGVETNM